MKIRLNYIYALMSMTLVLFLTGVFGSIVIQSQQLVRMFKERVMIIVEIDKGFVEDEIFALEDYIAQQDYVKAGSIQYTSKETAAEMMKEDFGSINLEEFNLVNPLYDIITFNVKAEYLNMGSLQAISDSLKVDERVSDISYEENLANTISNYWSQIGFIGLGTSLILAAVAIFLIVYAIRQALYTDRFVIKNMHLVGATPSFISRPYIRIGLIGGIISATLSALGILCIRVWLIHQIPSIGEIFTSYTLVIICLVLFAFGILVTTCSAWLSVRKYLKSDINQLYN